MTLQDKLGNEVKVELKPELNAYVISYTEGNVEAGRAYFLDHEQGGSEDRIFFHTEVSKEFGGRGLASVLAEQATNDAATAEKVVVAACPMIRGWLEKHGDKFEGEWRLPEYDDLVFLQKVLD